MSWNETISEIRILTPDDKFFYIPGENITWSKSYRFPACQTLDLFDYLKMEEITPLKITFDFERLENHRLTLHLEDRDKATSRTLMKNRQRAEWVTYKASKYNQKMCAITKYSCK